MITARLAEQVLRDVVNGVERYGDDEEVARFRDAVAGDVRALTERGVETSPLPLVIDVTRRSITRSDGGNFLLDGFVRHNVIQLKGVRRAGNRTIRVVDSVTESELILLDSEGMENESVSGGVAMTVGGMIDIPPEIPDIEGTQSRAPEHAESIRIAVRDGLAALSEAITKATQAQPTVTRLIDD